MFYVFDNNLIDNNIGRKLLNDCMIMPLNLLHRFYIPSRNKINRRSLTPPSPRPPNPMKVIIDTFWQIKI